VRSGVVSPARYLVQKLKVQARFYKSKEDMASDNWILAHDEQGADVNELGKGSHHSLLYDIINIIHVSPSRACYLWFRHQFIIFFTDDIQYSTTDNNQLRPFDRSKFGSNPVVAMRRVRERTGIFDLVTKERVTYKNNINRMEGSKAVAEEYRRFVEARVDLAKREVMSYTFRWSVPAGVDTSQATVTKPAPFKY